MFSCCCRKEKIPLGVEFEDPNQILKAIKEDDLELVKQLWIKGLNFNKEVYKAKNSLEVAVECGSLPVIQFIASHGAILSKKSSKKGWTILHIAAYRGDDAIFRYLFSITNVELRYELDLESKNIAHIAAFAGRFEVLRRLNEKEKKLVHLLDAMGENAMHKAARANNFEIVKYLHEICGISVKCQNFEGETPEQLAKEQQIIDYCVYWTMKENNGADHFISSTKNKIVGRDTT